MTVTGGLVVLGLAALFLVIIFFVSGDSSPLDALRNRNILRQVRKQPGAYDFGATLRAAEQCAACSITSTLLADGTVDWQVKVTDPDAQLPGVVQTIRNEAAMYIPKPVKKAGMSELSYQPKLELWHDYIVTQTNLLASQHFNRFCQHSSVDSVSY
jgi:hypothetical protein